MVKTHIFKFVQYTYRVWLIGGEWNVSSASFWQITLRWNSCVSEMTHSGQSRQSLFSCCFCFFLFFCATRWRAQQQRQFIGVDAVRQALIEFHDFMLFPLDSIIILWRYYCCCLVSTGVYIQNTIKSIPFSWTMRPKVFTVRADTFTLTHRRGENKDQHFYFTSRLFWVIFFSSFRFLVVIIYMCFTWTGPVHLYRYLCIFTNARM